MATHIDETRRAPASTIMRLIFQILRDFPLGASRTAEQLAQLYSVSRADVVQAMDEAKEFGVEVLALRGRGYELPRAVDWLHADRIMQALGPRKSGCQVRIFYEVESTNDSILSIVDRPVDSGLVVAAEVQTKGRGRRGRQWLSNLGGALTFSVLYRLRSRHAMSSASGLVVGVAIMRALRELGARGAALKWPNDVIDANGKLGGMLLESRTEGGRPDILVVGIGLNVENSALLKAQVGQPVSDLRGTGVVADRSTILGVILRHFFETMEQFDVQGFAQLRQEWITYAAYISRLVTLTHPNGEDEQGILQGIAEDGALLLATAQGHRRIYSGDLSLRLAQ